MNHHLNLHYAGEAGRTKLLQRLRCALVIFILLLALSGITAFPLVTEIDFLFEHKEWFPGFLMQWIAELHRDIHKTPAPMLYGTDWLAFAHIVISLFFIPVYINPVKYKVNLRVGMAACVLIAPLAFICGPLRSIPFFHQLIDCSFGLFGFLLLLYIHKKINRLEKEL
jgi:hypothetical protein